MSLRISLRENQLMRRPAVLPPTMRFVCDDTMMVLLGN